MNKKLFTYFLLLLALFLGALYYTKTIQSPLLSSVNNIKIFYHTVTQNIQNSIDKHFFQAQEITNLKEKLQTCQNNHLIIEQLTANLNNMYKENNTTLATNPKSELVRTISYEKFGNFNRLWLDIPEYNSSKIYGLVYKDAVAGIVIPKNGKALALLNNDIKSTYAVYIGKTKAPGITHGNNGKNLIASFIPAWFTIHIGDEVTTSGLDNLFFQGLKVGKVISITKSQGYQNAVIEPYYKSNTPSYFYLIRSVQ